jgi:hypothetical protein
MEPQKQSWRSDQTFRNRLKLPAVFTGWGTSLGLASGCAAPPSRALVFLRHSHGLSTDPARTPHLPVNRHPEMTPFSQVISTIIGSVSCFGAATRLYMHAFRRREVPWPRCPQIRRAHFHLPPEPA